jgi:hypothetical protein
VEGINEGTSTSLFFASTSDPPDLDQLGDVLARFVCGNHYEEW